MPGPTSRANLIWIKKRFLLRCKIVGEEMELHYLQEMCFIQFVETNQFMSILCCMVAFYIPVSIMSGLYIRVWWETVKRQRDLVHLQAGKKASSKRSDSSEEVDPVRQGENPDVACNRPSNGNRNSFNGRIRYLLQSCSSTEVL